jgi:hypothetical protein
MPSMADSWRPAFHRAALASAAARAWPVQRRERLHVRLALGDGFQAALDTPAAIGASRNRPLHRETSGL